MKRSVSSFFNIVIKLSAALAACIGCTPKEANAPRPGEIRWRGSDTEYSGTTVVQPNDGKEHP